MDLTSLHSVYVHQLKDLYSAEKQIIDAMPSMIEAATTQELKEAFSAHFEESKSHLDKVHGILQDMDVNPGNTKCDAMEGIIKEGSDIVNTDGDPAAKDAALIASAQRIEHYEIAGYGTTRAFATSLGYSEAASTLQMILDEEYEADQKLDKLAEGSFLTSGINAEAMATD